jgi:hypothetical protein
MGKTTKPSIMTSGLHAEISTPDLWNKKDVVRGKEHIYYLVKRRRLQEEATGRHYYVTKRVESAVLL